MKTAASYLVVTAVVFTLGLTGCAQKPKSADAGAAIQQSSAMATVDEKAKFLVSEANAFLSSQKYEDAMKLANHVLSQVDQNSAEAKSILEKAQAEIKALAEKKAAEMKAELEKKMGSLGQ
ncbi:MAG: hypothetical protein Q8Q08_04720 [Candidatus Omnitrophota bacterium]|nr:hypothetical protein [Candidatus Omnitrophota bacterium]